MVQSSVPDEWPLDREPEGIEEKHGPFDSESELRQHRGEEIMDRLGEDGYWFLEGIWLVRKFLLESDMTPEEAIECLEYEIESYENES